MDFKNTPQGRTVQKKYGNILYAVRPELPQGHPRMDIQNRAKIFSPFAALRGYEDEIRSETREHLKGSRIEVSDEEKEKISSQIQKLAKGTRVSIRYFSDGFYEDIEGTVVKMDSLNQMIYLHTETRSDLKKDIPIIIAFEDILSIN